MRYLTLVYLIHNITYGGVLSRSGPVWPGGSWIWDLKSSDMNNLRTRNLQVCIQTRSKCSFWFWEAATVELVHLIDQQVLVNSNQPHTPPWWLLILQRYWRDRLCDCDKNFWSHHGYSRSTNMCFSCCEPGRGEFTDESENFKPAAMGRSLHRNIPFQFLREQFKSKSKHSPPVNQNPNRVVQNHEIVP